MIKRIRGREFLLVVMAFAVTFWSTAAMASTVVGLQVVNKSIHSETNVPVTFGQIFKDGDVPTGAHLKAALLDGTTVPIQVDPKVHNSDGSLRHAVITVVVPKLSASATKVITLSTGGTTASGQVSLDDLLKTDFDATVELYVDGTKYTASARKLLEQANSQKSCTPWGKDCNLWLSGPKVSEWIVHGPVTTAGGQQSKHLSARFYVRAYAGSPIKHVRVNVVVENAWSYPVNNGSWHPKILSTVQESPPVAILTPSRASIITRIPAGTMSCGGTATTPKFMQN